MIRAAIIGLGRIGSGFDAGIKSGPPRTHTGAILQTSDFDLTAASDSSPGNRAAFRSQWGLPAPVYATAKELFEHGPYDVVTVATPAESHADIIQAALALGPRVIFCEKPFCGSVEDARKTAESAKKKGIPILVNYHRRWDPKIRALRERLAGLGAPRRVNVVYRKGLFNYGSHIVDLLEYLFGPIVGVAAEPLTPRQGAMEDPSISARLRFQTGFDAAMIGIDDVQYDLFDVEMFFDGCKFSLEMGGYKIRYYVGREGLYFPAYINLAETPCGLPDGPVSGLLQAYSEIREHLLQGSQLSTGLADSAIRASAVLDAIRSSAQRGVGIAINPVVIPA